MARYQFVQDTQGWSLTSITITWFFIITLFFPSVGFSGLETQLQFNVENASVVKNGEWLTYLNQGDIGYAYTNLPQSFSKLKCKFKARKPAAVNDVATNFGIYFSDTHPQELIGFEIQLGQRQARIVKTTNFHDKQELNKIGDLPWIGDGEFEVEAELDLMAGTIEVLIGDKTLKVTIPRNIKSVNKMFITSYKQGVEIKDLTITGSQHQGAILIEQKIESRAFSDGYKSDSYYSFLAKEDFKMVPKLEFILGEKEEEVMKSSIFPSGDAFTNGLAQAELISCEGQPFRYAWKIHTKTGIKQTHGAMLVAFNKFPVRKDDRLVLVYYHKLLRTSSEDGTVENRVWLVPKGWQGEWQANQFFTSYPKWQRNYLPFIAKQDFPPGLLELQIHLGNEYHWKEILLGGIALVNAGQDISLSLLPQDQYILKDYEGRDPNAEWRKQALERIETLRKGSFKIQVTDSAGDPIPQAQVTVTMEKHAFRWGAAPMTFELLPIPDLHRNGKVYSEQELGEYRSCFTSKKMFNYAVLANELKWGPWVEDEPRYRREWAIQALQWLKSNGVECKGHTLHWGLRDLPEKLGLGKGLQLSTPDPRVQDAIFSHIRDITQATKEYISTWDVVNEHFGYHLSSDLFGKQLIVDCFRMAHELCGPQVRLFWNECSLTRDMGTYTQQWIEYLLKEKAPIHGIGWQFHVKTNSLVPIPLVLKTLDTYAKYKLDIELTEFDVGLKNPHNPEEIKMQCDYLRDILIACFSHPQVTGIVYWSWKEPAWMDHAELVREDGSLTPAGKVWQEWVTQKWFTPPINQLTDQKGITTFTGYYGVYLVEVLHQGKKTEQRISFTVNESIGKVKVSL